VNRDYTHEHANTVITRSDFAVRTSLSEASVDRLLRAGAVPFIRLTPKRIGIKLGSLWAWLDEKTIDSNSTPNKE